MQARDALCTPSSHTTMASVSFGELGFIGELGPVASGPGSGGSGAAVPRDQRVRAAVVQLEASPRALDVLLRMLTQLAHEPRNPKYRTVSLTNPAFARVVASVVTILSAIEHREEEPRQRPSQRDTMSRPQAGSD